MKRSRRIFTLLSALLLSVVITAFAVAADTEGSERVTPDIKAYSLSLKENVHILYAVDFGDVPSGAEYGLLVWEMEEGDVLPSAFTHAYAPDACLAAEGVTDVSGVSCSVFRYNGLAAKQMTDYVYTVPFIRYAGDAEYTYGEPAKYSIMQYALSSAGKESSALLDKMLDYGAKAQSYFGYRLDRLANEDYVLATLRDATFSDGFTVEVMKPGETVTPVNVPTPLAEDADEVWYMASEDGCMVLLERDAELVAPDVSFLLAPSVRVMNNVFANGKADGTDLTGKGTSTYTVMKEENGNYYVKHYKGAGSGNDSQADSTETYDPTEHMYDPATGEYATTKLTYTIKLARTEADVATVKFRLRHYSYSEESGSSSKDAEATLFSTDKYGNVNLGGSLTVGTLTSSWQTYSFVIDFAAGDASSGDNVFVYRDGHFLASMTEPSLKASTFVKYDAEYADKERAIINLYSLGSEEGELLYDDIIVSLGETPISEEAGGIINYHLNGATLPADAVTRYDYAAATVLPIPTKAGYDFVGWYLSESFVTSITEIPAGTRGIVDLYAKFVATDSYIDTLKETNSAFSTDSFAAVDTTNQYNLGNTKYVDGVKGLYDDYEGGDSTDKSVFEYPLVGKQDNYALVGYGDEVIVSEVVKLPTDTYPAPLGTPEGMAHPYLYFTAEDIPAIKATLDHPDMEAAVSKLWALANTENFTGEFEAKTKNGITYRYDKNTLAIIEAKAFAYVLTGDEAYGYEAIIGIKNAMLTVMYTTEQHTDPYHGPVHVLTTLVKVFDWCYDLLSDTDKEQLMLGAQNRLCAALEYNLFRKGQGLSSSLPNIGYVSGHGTGGQFIKDYVNMALCFYTEETSWWDYIGGKYFAEYVGVWDVVYKSGWVSQGTAGYGLSKYYYVLLSAFVINNATGVMPSHADGAELGAYFLVSHINGADKYFTNGDGARASHGTTVTHEYMILHAALYNDPALYAAAKYYSNSFTTFMDNSADGITVPLTLIYSSYISEETKAEYPMRGDGIDHIQYFGEGNGFMSARNSWDSDSTSVFMKIGEMTMANHDIADHGTFQIYYKGMLAGSSGAYNKYGSYVHEYYLQSTVAHNGLLVFNPARADAAPVYGTNADGSENVNVISNASRYYYSGSQRVSALGEASTLDRWLNSGDYNTAKVTGAQYAYNADGSSHYAYIAGDITEAYYADTVDYVGRRMLAVYTGNESAPMLFFVFDSITSKDADFTKTFLLHTVDEPTVSEDGQRAEIFGEFGGKLTLDLVSGAEKITKIGGLGYAYWINGYYDGSGAWVDGKNLLDQYTTTDNVDKMWGRLEIAMRGNLTDNLLTAMYVSDADADVTLSAEKLDTGDGISGVRLGSTAVLFTESRVRYCDRITASTGTDGELLSYFVSGVAAGEWSALVDGEHIATLTSTEEGGLLCFTAPAGELELLPGEGVATGYVVYNANGGNVNGTVSYYFNADDVITLPTDVVRAGYAFDGWYTTPTCDDGSEIWYVEGSEMSGEVNVYAKWNTVYVDEDYSATTVDLTETTHSKAVNSVTYAPQKKVGAAFKTNKDGNGIGYLVWTEGESDPAISVQGLSASIATSSATSFSYTFSMSRDGEATPMQVRFRMLANKTVDGTTLSATAKFNMIETSTSGEIKLGDTVIGELYSDSVTTVRTVLDFAAGTVAAYDESGNVIHSVAMELPPETGATSASDLQQCYANYFIQLYASTSYTAGADYNALRFYGIRIEEGNAFERKTVVGNNDIVYEVNGGTLPEGAPTEYSRESATALPIPVREEYTFDGWYTASTFDEGTRVEEVPVDTLGEYTVYAKWSSPYIIKTDFAGSTVNSTSTVSQTYEGMTFGTRGKTDASFVTATDASGKDYILWTKGETDSLLSAKAAAKSLSETENDEVSFIFSFAKAGDTAAISSQIRLISTSPASGSSSGNLILAKISSAGEVTLNGGAELGTLSSDGTVFTLRIVVDFANAMIKAYGEDGSVIASVSFAPKVDVDGDGVSDSVSALEWKQYLTNYLFYWYSNSINTQEALRIYGIAVADGNIFE